MMMLALSVTAFAAQPRAEYPRPQFVRSAWQNLNGEWGFQIDNDLTGKADGLASATTLSGKIVVPFAPESRLSGVAHTAFMNSVWYNRSITIPSEWSGKRIMLNFGAVDFLCEVYVDGGFVGSHAGGTSSFSIDLTPCVFAGQTVNLTVYAEDKKSDFWKHPSGKQCNREESYGCFYTRTTGIWQTVWLEAVNPCGLRRVKVTPDVDNSQFVFNPEYYGIPSGGTLSVEIFDGSRKVASKTVAAANSSVAVVPLKKAKLWSPESPFLYDVRYTVKDSDGKVIDRVESYAGMRKISWVGRKLYLNNEPLFLRTVLDQGFYPEGIWTAPSDEALRGDIEMSIAAGFNGARLHQKVFEERFHYWADRLGYLTFGEASDWGSNRLDPEAQSVLMREMSDNINRDYNHPSIIGWTPMNEAWGLKPKEAFWRFNDQMLTMINAIDPTRPCNSVSGGSIHTTDIWTVHTYEQDPAKLKEQLTFKNGYPQYLGQAPYREVRYSGQPYFVDEFGGIKWNPTQQRDNVNTASWGYGEPPASLDEFYARLEGQVEAIVSNPDVCGFCYTQLTDVEQEQNGIYFYNRTPKFDMTRIHTIFSMPRK